MSMASRLRHLPLSATNQRPTLLYLEARYLAARPMRAGYMTVILSEATISRCPFHFFLYMCACQIGFS
jgi:hypothetical protein